MAKHPKSGDFGYNGARGPDANALRLMNRTKNHAMILEALITTENADGTPHLSAIGPHVDAALLRWELKPFNSSRTYANLRRTNRCVIHVTDDALMLAACVCGEADEAVFLFDEQLGYLMPSACRSFALIVDRWELADPRSTAAASIIRAIEQRPFWGWNRGKHGVLELAITATRIDWLPADEIDAAVKLAEDLVGKTGGEAEHAALQKLRDFIARRVAARRQPG